MIRSGIGSNKLIFEDIKLKLKDNNT